MRTRTPSFLSRQRTKLSVLALAAVGIIGLAANASANSTANTTIMNVVTVNYKDAGGINNFAANASTIVTVNLVKAALNTVRSAYRRRRQSGPCLSAGV